MAIDARNRRGGTATLRTLIPTFIVSLALPGAGRAQGATDLFLVHLREVDGRIGVDSVVRLTDRDGYDNQPFILPDGRALLYTSIDAAGQADIFRIDLSSRRTSNVTRTAPESEYSATLMPSGDRFSTIRVEADSTQRLWSFRLDGSDARPVLERLKPIGYHAWIDEARVAVFVLGDPATLQVADVRDGSARTVATDIGRSLNRVPGRTAVSFVHREGGSPWIKVFDAAAGTLTPLIEPLPGNEYHVWTPSGRLVTGAGSTLYEWRPGSDEGWVRIADLSASGVAGISRLALSADGRLLAVVASH